MSQGSRPRKSTSKKQKEKVVLEAEDSYAQNIDWETREANSPLPLPIAWDGEALKDVEKSESFSALVGRHEWTDRDSFFYNGWRKVKMRPTQFACTTTLRRMGIAREISRMMTRLGMGTIATQQYPLYPELVRQFLSSCDVVYRNERVRRASQGSLTFKLDGVFHQVSLRDFCSLYGFDAERETCVLSSTWSAARPLWRLLAQTPVAYSSKTSRQAEIQHPVPRIFAKILSSTIVCKMENNKMRASELQLLHHALGEVLPFTDEHPVDHDYNMGAIFAHHLVGLRATKPFGHGRHESIGSLLTPLFRFVKAKTSPERLDPARDSLNEAALKIMGILESDLRYCYTDPAGVSHTLQLPSPYTRLTRHEDLRFYIPGSDSDSPGSPVGASSSAPPQSDFPPLSPPPAHSEPEEKKWDYVYGALAKIYSFVTTNRCRCSRDDVVQPPPRRSSPHTWTREDRDRHATGDGAGASGSGAERTRSTSPSDHL